MKIKNKAPKNLYWSFDQYQCFFIPHEVTHLHTKQLKTKTEMNHETNTDKNKKHEKNETSQEKHEQKNKTNWFAWTDVLVYMPMKTKEKLHVL